MARGRLPTPGRSRARPEPVWEEIRRELRRKGVTLRLLWREYRHDYPDGYQYSRFCERYGRWEAVRRLGRADALDRGATDRAAPRRLHLRRGAGDEQYDVPGGGSRAGPAQLDRGACPRV